MIYYTLTAEVRAPDLPIMRQVVTVTDPEAWALRCFGVRFGALCLHSTRREGVLYAQPSRKWQDSPALEGCAVRLLHMGRIMPHTLAHNLTSATTRAAAG